MDDLEQRLREVLPGLVPVPPTAPDRAAGARALARRARRRTVLVVAGASVAAIAGALLVPTLVGDREAPGPAGTTAQVRCAGRAPDAAGEGDLATDPTSVRLCAWGEASYEPPPDALLAGAAEVAEAVNELPDMPVEPICTMELGLSYALVFAYADGTQRAVTVEDYGCGEVQVLGGPTLRGASDLLPLFTGLLREQRGQEPTPGASAVRPTCRPTAITRTPLPISTVADVDAAVVCVRTLRQTGVSQAEITPAELDRLKDDPDPRRRGGALTTAACPPSTFVYLRGSNARGEVFTAPLCSERGGEGAPWVKALVARAVPE